MRYHYVGPADILATVRPGEAGQAIGSPDDLTAWLTALGPGEADEPVTFVVDLAGSLRLAPRRSEHVACAAGEPVRAAGEIAFDPDGGVRSISNQSTGYCPDPDCWPAVAAALDRAGVPHPGGFTAPVVFRRRPDCGERNLVKDGHFACAVCDADLPEAWNLA